MISNDTDDPTLDRNRVVPAPLIEAIAEALVASPHVASTDRIRNRLRDRIRADAGGSGAAGSTGSATDAAIAPASTARPTSGAAAIAGGCITLRESTTSEGWVELLPKAHAKLLFTDGEAESYMIRLEPGAWAPAHEHPANEECLVLEGSLWQGDIFLEAGDFHVARPGDKHGDLRTETGALVFIRYGKPLAQYLQT